MGTRLSLPLMGVALAALTGCGGTEFAELQPAQLELTEDLLEFGLAEAGEVIEKRIVVQNKGNVALGIKSIALGTDLEPDSNRGHADSFKLIWSCNDLIDPNAGNEEADDAKGPPPPPAPDSGETGCDSGDCDSEPDETDTDPGEVGHYACVLPRGASLPVNVRFKPRAADDNWDSIIVESEGDSSWMEESELNGIPAHERVYRDLDNTWVMAYLHGVGEATEPNALIQPKTVDFGFVFEAQTEKAYISIRNVGDGELVFLNAEIDDNNCTGDFAITYEPEPNSIIAGDMAKVVEVTFNSVDDREAQCYIDITTSDADAPVERVLLKSNSGVNPANQPPVVKIHSPAPGYQHFGLHPVRLELTVFDANEPASNLYCKVRSAFQGYIDGKPALANCTPKEGNTSGHMFVDVPVDEYVTAGTEVLLVKVTDSSGITREASVPILLNSDFPASDDDGDGFGTDDPEWPDCDDTDTATHPVASEIADGEDNDCDNVIDEGTDGFDDDGDGMSENEGDCNDTNPNTYKSAPEIKDGADNDCDGLIDENTTAYDDDGDGFAELDLDCDDTDPTINPGAPEICSDGIDNNCNGLKDSSEPNCIDVDSIPMIVGRIKLSKTSIESEGVTQASVRIHEADGDKVTHRWEVKDGKGFIDDPSAPSISWTAPELPSEYSDGNVYRLYYVGTDDDENQAWDFSQVWVYEQGDLSVTILQPIESSGCSAVPVFPGAMLMGLGMLTVFARRREE